MGASEETCMPHLPCIIEPHHLSLATHSACAVVVVVVVVNPIQAKKRLMQPLPFLPTFPLTQRLRLQVNTN